MSLLTLKIQAAYHVFTGQLKNKETVANAITELKNELVRISSSILIPMHEKTVLKKIELDLELQKFDFEKELKNNPKRLIKNFDETVFRHSFIEKLYKQLNSVNFFTVH